MLVKCLQNVSLVSELKASLVKIQILKLTTKMSKFPCPRIQQYPIICGLQGKRHLESHKNTLHYLRRIASRQLQHNYGRNNNYRLFPSERLPYSLNG
jgi:hypothetical protein